MAGRETPAVRAARAAGIAFTLHEYEHDPRAASYGLEAVDALGLDAARVFKTLVVDVAGALTTCADPRRRDGDGTPDRLRQRRARGLEIELAPADLVSLTDAQVRRLRR